MVRKKVSKWSWVCCLLAVLGCSGAPRAPSGVQAAGAAAGGAGSPAGAPAPAGAGQGASGGGSGSGAGGAGGGAGAAGKAGSAGAAIDADDAGANDAAAGGPAAMSGEDAGVTPPVRSTGPGDWVAGDYPPNLMGPNYLEIAHGGRMRQYKVHIPPSYKPSVPSPVVFCIHGLGQDALLFCVTGAAMHTESDASGFVLVMPNGYQNSWNAGTCCGAASSERVDDVGLFRAIFAEVSKHVNIDLGRVYATGLSNGGFMSYRLLCEAADIFSAVAPSAAAIGKNDIGGGTNPDSDFTTCEPSRPVSVLHIHGTEDPLIPYSRQAPSLAHLAMKYGCATTTRPALQPPSAGDTSCVSYEGCPAGIELTACSVDGGGHCWFGSPDCGTGGGPIGLAIVGANSDTLRNTPVVWDFLEKKER